jgi:hypothetical protein
VGVAWSSAAGSRVRVAGATKIQPFCYPPGDISIDHSSDRLIPSVRDLIPAWRGQAQLAAVSESQGAASDKVKEALRRAQAEREEALLQVGRSKQKCI